MKLFVDDIRNPEDIYQESDWVVVRSYEEAVERLNNGDCTVISLDHDLGSDEPTGYDLAKWLSNNNAWPEQVYVHSANPVDSNNIIKEYKFWLKYYKGKNNSWEL